MSETTPPRSAVIAGFLAVYLIWGSTYLAIAFAIETIPPFLMAASRFLMAGTVMFAIAKMQGAPNPSLREWRSALIIGALLLFVANSGLVWVEKRIASSLVALIVAVVPMWMVLVDWVWNKNRPSRAVILGVVGGFAGVAFLIGPEQILNQSNTEDVLLSLMVVLCSLGWSIGSIYARRAPLPKNASMTTAAEMLSGSLLIGLFSLANGEWGSFEPAEVSLKSGLSLFYLTIFGSIVAFSAYVWILRVSTPARVSTYAYVNPVVALFLGWALADEEITARTLIAAAIILGSVVMITLYRNRTPTTNVPEPIEAAVEIGAVEPERTPVRSTGPINVQPIASGGQD